MKYLKQMLCVSICGVMLVAATGCSGSLTGGKRIIRISHAQSETHPEHLGLLKFKEYVEANLGNKYEVQIFPNELLGSAQKAIELTRPARLTLSWPVPPTWKPLPMCTRFSACPTCSPQKKLTMPS